MYNCVQEGVFMEYTEVIEKWGVFEAALEGPEEGNPFTEQRLTGIFSSARENVITEGFYDGSGVYRIRFMPSSEGKYSFVLRGTFLKEPASGSFTVIKPSGFNHGPVRVTEDHHFRYEDGTPYISIGTTAYVFELQGDELIEETFRSLSEACFNKIRFCIFPKHYAYNIHEPRSYPYEGMPMDSSVLDADNFMDYMWKKDGNHFDLTRFNPAHFRHIESCIRELGNRGIEADIIVMHPYDRWGFSSMSREEDDLYWNYVIRRFSAFRNVWWALANEWDLLFEKTEDDWEHYADLLMKNDMYGHLRSIHNCRKVYDQHKPWITHVSYQRIDLYKGAELTDELIREYQKPVVMDEIAYEGDIQYGWGNITPEEMVRRFWETALRGGYPGHSETYLNNDNILWWSHGGKLRGESWKRFRFLYDILKDVPGSGLVRTDLEWDSLCAVPSQQKDMKVRDLYLFYYSFMRPSFREFHIDDETEFIAEVIDTWNMTADRKGIYKGKFRVELPARQYMAVRLRKNTGTELPAEEEETASQEPLSEEDEVPMFFREKPEEPEAEIPVPAAPAEAKKEATLDIPAMRFNTKK